MTPFKFFCSYSFYFPIYFLSRSKYVVWQLFIMNILEILDVAEFTDEKPFLQYIKSQHESAKEGS